MNPPSHGAAYPATLLYVEDEENDVLFMRRALSRAGIEVKLHTVADGDRAVGFFAGETDPAGIRPDLVLLDLNLPIRSGFEVLAWLRQQPALRTMPVVIISSSGRPEDIERARALGADDYVVKPTSPNRLAEIAAELWSRWLSPEARAHRNASDAPAA